MPLFDLLVMKTQGWWNRCVSYQVAKAKNDASDIFALLERAKLENVSYVDEANEDRHSPKFMNYAHILANRFVRAYGKPQQWKALGFSV
jgi:hypothetical protein